MDAVLSDSCAIPQPTKTQAVTQCAHCAAPVLGENTVGRAHHEPAFCCSGCRYVYHLIQKQGLGEFYELRDAPLSPASGSVFQRQNFEWLSILCAHTDGKFALEIQGLSCVACVWLIKKVFESLEGALEIRVDMLRATLELHVDASRFPAVKFGEGMHRLGYRLGPIGPESSTAPSNKPLVVRMGVCGALAMNAMLFATPAYCGLETGDHWTPLFARGAVFCATGSMVVGASYFVRKAWQAARMGWIHMDLPIALGLIAAYAGSLVAWVSGESNALYLDFVSIFTFLMLVGRWVHQRAVDVNRRRLLQTPAAFIRPNSGDTYVLLAGMAVPVRSVLLSQEANFGMEWISGESEARCSKAGQAVSSGAIYLGDSPLELKALESWDASLLAKLVTTPPAKPAAARSEQRFIMAYLVGVLIIAAAGFAGWLAMGKDTIASVQVFVSVLVVSCPCASGVALPLVAELASARMRDLGVFVREPSLWRRLLQVRRVVFDKTGTLTEERPQLCSREEIDNLPPEASAALSVLVSRSMHPVATALREALAQAPVFDSNAIPVDEAPGIGLEWKQEPDLVWRLGRASWATNQPDSIEGNPMLTRNGEPVASFAFKETLRLDAQSEVHSLRSCGYEVGILSGDHPERVSRVARALGLVEDSCVGGLTPEGKATWLQAHQGTDHTLMLGDGANDALAFSASLACGTPAVDRGVLENRSDFYYLGRGLSGVRALLKMAAFKRKVAARVLAFTTLYNVGAISLALTGKMNPLSAAVLMPLSSLATLCIVILSFRSAPVQGCGLQTRVKADQVAE